MPEATEVKKDVKYSPFTADYEDFDGNERKYTLRFRRPGRKELTTIAKTSKAKQFDVMCKVITQIAHPDDVEQMKDIIKNEPVLALSFVDTVFKKCGSGVVEPGN
ncbi:hypothetical protein [Halodesulfovibrio aestuarii]|uniref:Uncharacterized protein n=1 Tax=Halodesulfovibrio aestuarii TaxID=126333 RepID=A0A8G2C7B8_9BACT|nr:hypothetical protein [Halodesulfovibrio aestuarii]SHI61025.1 hypothetical protein SAMN05660830_00449 [Halodesulfovibrio aestuarii]